MLKLAFRALAIAIYTLIGAAMIVDARREGGLPEGFPLLAQLRETRDRFAFLGGAGRTASPELANVPSAAGAAPDWGTELRPDSPDLEAGRMPAAEAPGVGSRLDPPLPTGDTGVRVNRGLP